mmetsp:Transcript_13421/g.16116  ORF Transcript_13421/g.16116 Transcript_13421/m.16116 type:complete len:95 (+) Transcript_13421:221-505(+)
MSTCRLGSLHSPGPAPTNQRIRIHGSGAGKPNVALCILYDICKGRSNLLILRGRGLFRSYKKMPVAKETHNGEEHQRHVNRHREFEKNCPFCQS